MPKKIERKKFAEVEEVVEDMPTEKQYAVQDGKRIEIDTPQKEVAIPLNEEKETKEDSLLVPEEIVPNKVEEKKDAVELSEKQVEEAPKKEKSCIGSIIVTFIVTSLLAGGIFYFISFNKPMTEEEKPVITETPTPTEMVKEIDRSLIDVEILNGSGVSGVAKEASEKIEAMGYKIEKTGNATIQDGNTLFISEDLKDFSEDMILDFKDYTILEIEETYLEGTSSAKLILGK